MKYSFLILLILTSLGCGEDNDCIINYIFDIPIEISPTTETLSVGDTLTINMIIDNKNIQDKHGNRIVKIPYFDPNAWFLMPMIDTFPVKDGLLKNEVIINESYETQHISVSTLSSGIFFLGIDAMESESRLDFKIVLNQKGTYALYSASGLYDRDQANSLLFENRCGESKGGTIDAEFSYTNAIHENILTNQNKSIEDEYWQERSGQRTVSSPYYFRVIE